MPVSDIGDPRLQALFGAADVGESGVRPSVRLPGNGLPPAVIAAGALILAVVLFAVLNERRTRPSEPSVRSQVADGSATGWEAPPPLYIPPVQSPAEEPPTPEQQKANAQSVPAPVSLPRVAPSPVFYAPQPLAQIPPPRPAASEPAQRTSTGSALVIDTSVAGGGPSPPATATTDSSITMSMQPITRLRASALANRSMTVPQGYLIQAVLETGFDSTKPGYARAVVSRDVRGFDGKNILIPRGSRLIGAYPSTVVAGQKRAIISWTRLIRPDGMTIAMDSPSVDTLGRGGIPASVNTHFFARLGDALLQTTVQLGSAFATRRVSGPVIVLPGNGVAPMPQVADPTTYVPTLTVAPGKSISVFVAHDLDFSAVGPAR